MNYCLDQELANGSAYQPLLTVEDAPEFPLLAGGQSYEWAAEQNLDAFFKRVYKYWQEKGFTTLAISGLLSICALLFTIAFSGFLLIFVNWGALHSECIIKDTCDITKVAVYADPLREKGVVWTVLAVVYLMVFAVYWTWTICIYVTDLVEMYEVRHFYANRLGISDRQIKVMTWAEVVHRLVLLQRTMRLCIARDLTELDVVSRIMRKENYLIAMLNKGVLALQPPLPGLRRRPMLTKTLHWNLYFGILDCMFDDHFQVRCDFLAEPWRLRRRLQWLALANLLASPFLLVFLLILFFMRNAERFYHHPASIASRRWSILAKWRLHEFNELPHYLHQRLAASNAAAMHYVAQFPNPAVAHIARFVAYVTGSFAALLLFVTLMDEKLLERPLFGRHLVWWAATLGVVLAVSRSFVPDDIVAPDPERAMAEVVAHTHWLPRHWRGRAGSEEVQRQFQVMFQYRAILLVEEMASLLLNPFILYFTLADCADNITAFVRNNTARIEGVGDICSYAAFDFDTHGNAKYGAPTNCPKEDRSRQGKMEKSFLTFATTYPTWTPPPAAKALLSTLATHQPSHPNHLNTRLAASSMALDPSSSAGPYPRAPASTPHPPSSQNRLPHHLPMPHTGPSPAPAAPSHNTLRSQLLASSVQHLSIRAFHSIHQAHCTPPQPPDSIPKPPHPSYPSGTSLTAAAGIPPNTTTTTTTFSHWQPASDPPPPTPFSTTSRLHSTSSASRLHSMSSGGLARCDTAVTISGLLPVNEEEELDARLVVGHSVMQNFYEEKDDTVAHRLHSRARSLAGGLSPALSELLARHQQQGAEELV